MEPKMARRELEGDTSTEQHVRQAGLCADTIILTMDGELRASDIAPGDRIITRDSGVAVLRDVRRTTLRCDLVRIKAGSLGHKRPPDDITLPCNTSILIRDWRAKALFGKDQALIEAQDLQDGEYIKVERDQAVELIELIFDKPHVVYAGGLEVACQTPT